MNASDPDRFASTNSSPSTSRRMRNPLSKSSLAVTARTIPPLGRPLAHPLDAVGGWGHAEEMNELLVGYARVSTEHQDLTAQRDALRTVGVGDDRIYVDHGLTGTNRDRPGLRLALAACRSGDTLVVTKLDRLARCLPDARDILAELTAKNVRLSLGGSIHEPNDPIGRLLFNVLAMVAEFESDLIRMRTGEGMNVARAKGHLKGKQPKLTVNQARHLLELDGLGTYSTGRVVRCQPLHDLPNAPARQTGPGRPTPAVRQGSGLGPELARASRSKRPLSDRPVQHVVSIGTPSRVA